MPDNIGMEFSPGKTIIKLPTGYIIMVDAFFPNLKNNDIIRISGYGNFVILWTDILDYADGSKTSMKIILSHCVDENHEILFNFLPLP